MSTPVRRKRRACSSTELWTPPSPKRSRFQRETTGNRRVNYAEPDDGTFDDDDISFTKQPSVPKHHLELLQTPPSSPDLPNQLPIIEVINLVSDDEGEYDDVVEVAPEGLVSKIFKRLPLEIHQTISRFLPCAKDVTTYAEVCKSTFSAITASVWRERFVETFDLIDGKSTEHLAQVYKRRIKLRNQQITFDLQQFPRLDAGSRTWQLRYQASLLKVVIDMILQSNACHGRDNDGSVTTTGKNQAYFADWILQAEEGQETYLDLIDAILLTENDWDANVVVSAKEEESLVLVVQLCLAWLFLDYEIVIQFRNFHQSQAQAYADDSKQPVFVGKWKTYINVRWLLHTLNFFACHLKVGRNEGVLCDDYFGLPNCQLPQPWVGKLQDETQALGTSWKGAYTYMSASDLAELRTAHDTEGFFFIDEHEPIQDIGFFFDESKFPSTQWPRSFEQLIETNPYLNDIDFSPTPMLTRRSRNRRSPSSTANAGVRPTEYVLKSFFGSSNVPVKAHYYGRIHALPPQQGIPGFQRISFLRFQLCAHGELDESQIWGYEGCVMPGNRIIVGKWWHITTNHFDIEPVDKYSGPFIFWNVDNSSADPPIDHKAAVQFLESLRKNGFAY